MTAAFLASLAVVSAILQAGLPLRWSPVDLPLLLVAFAGLSRGNGLGLACGVAAGLTLDCLLGGPAGLRLAPLALTGALADALQPGVNRDQPRLQVLAVLALTFFHDGCLALMARRLGVPQYGPRRAVLEYELPRLAAQALGCLPLFGLLGVVVRQRVFQDRRQGRVKTIRRWQ